MKSVFSVSGAALMAASVALTGCTVPRLGPNVAEIAQAGPEEGGSIPVIPITRQVAEVTQLAQVNSVPNSFASGGAYDVNRIRPGDILGIAVYENVEEGLLSRGGAAAQIPEIQVEEDGTIFLPFAGELRAAGRTVSSLRQEIFRALADQTPEPQVIVRREEGTYAAFRISGDVASTGPVLIQTDGTTLTQALTDAGGVAGSLGQSQITVFRGNARATVWGDALFNGEVNDFFIQPGDRILVEATSRQFVALGAVGGQTLVEFESADTSLIDAVGIVGGLDLASSNPAGVFVFRSEEQRVFSSLSEGLVSETNDIIYALDMRDVESVFAARNFHIRDGDFIYITETPVTQFSRILTLFTSNIGAVRGL